MTRIRRDIETRRQTYNEDVLASDATLKPGRRHTIKMFLHQMRIVELRDLNGK